MQRLGLLFLLATTAASAQTAAEAARFRQAGVCARCHVGAVLEWSTSKHTSAAVDCKGCHGPSEGHVVNERNQVLPDRIPHGAAIAGLCATCHHQGCPKTRRKDDCQSCHHIHALFNPADNKQLSPSQLPEEQRARDFQQAMAAGEKLAGQSNWTAAQDRFETALKLFPSHPRAGARLAYVRRRLDPRIPGFEIVGTDFDAASGLPLRVRVTGLPIEMALIPRGDADLGDERTGPVHTVPVEAFYLARTELTQQAWTQVVPENPSIHKGADLPVNGVSWHDARKWIEALNGRVEGAGFRLPSEAEWEYAARTGNPGGALAGRAWFRKETADSKGFKELNAYAPQGVATLTADARGVYDLAGNVWEWCASLLQPYPYDAHDGRESADAVGLRVLRGGGYADSPQFLAPTMRHGERPDRRLPFNGFRLARSVPVK